MSRSGQAPSNLHAVRRFYTIPAGMPFAKIVARSLLEQGEYIEKSAGSAVGNKGIVGTGGTRDAGGAEVPSSASFSLPDMTVLLPTRRACRTMRDIFLDLSDGRPLLLPRIQPLGDVDEQDLSLSLADPDLMNEVLSIPQAISPLQRKFILARLITAREDFTQGYDKALLLADELGRFLDQLSIEELEFDRLYDLVPEDFADHWQVTLDFLKIVSEHWPKILQDHGKIDAAPRRNLLLDLQARHWTENPPQTPVIVAGTTGSIPATARLLDVVASLPHGAVILPGYDRFIDPESWSDLAPSHPQYGFKHLFETIGLNREQVKIFPFCKDEDRPRTALARNMMAPVSQTAQWCNWPSAHHNGGGGQGLDFKAALHGIYSLECRNETAEAMAVALKIRETLEDPARTIALITPDRKLARQVSALCRRWSIAVDDSAGIPLPQTVQGSFLVCLLEYLKHPDQASVFLALAKHSLCTLGCIQSEKDVILERMERDHIRKNQPGFSLEMLVKSSIEDESVYHMVRVIGDALDPLLTLLGRGEEISVSNFITLVIQALDQLAVSPEGAPASPSSTLWTGQEGEEISAFISDITGQDQSLGHHPFRDMIDILKTLMEGQVLRPRYGLHPRCSILGQLEARMVEADTLILAGLNEGVWPADPGFDPWMSRSMRGDLDLSPLERLTGLSAHDFVQGFCAESVLLTRSARRDGAPAVPSRWLVRLETFLDAAGQDARSLYHAPYAHWADSIDEAETLSPVLRPAPTPPVSARPKKLSVTKIEQWIIDPYTIYAQAVLKLKALDPLDKPLSPLEKGNILHGILEDFIKLYPKGWPGEKARSVLQDLMQDHLHRYDAFGPELVQWVPRLERILDWFYDTEKNRRGHNDFHAYPEQEGSIDIRTSAGHDFTLYGRADRMDHLGQNDYTIIDYKSGGNFSLSKMKSGETPQLVLESMMMDNGGFKGVGENKCSALSYWVMTGGEPPGAIKGLNGQEVIEAAIQDAHAGLCRYIDAYAIAETPYYSTPRGGRNLRYSDYNHLARIDEWGVLGEGSDDAA